MKCWICGSAANSREHIIKASDLKSIFGHIHTHEPIYLHTGKRRNELVQGLNSKKLKFTTPICSDCNNKKTQTHDRAWEKLSDYFRNPNTSIQHGASVHLDKVFPGSVKRSMLETHLFFVKQFGCLIAEHQIPIDLKVFSDAILKNIPHPLLHLRFVAGLGEARQKLVSRSDVNAVWKNGSIAFASWFYVIDRIAVNVIYATPLEQRMALVNSWHPSKVSKRGIRVVSYDK